MARYLIVCGGAGRGLLGQRDVLNIDEELQIDVQNQARVDLKGPGHHFVDISDVGTGTAGGAWDKQYRQLQSFNDSAQHLNHAHFLRHWWPAGLNALVDGLSRTPALGVAAFHLKQHEIWDIIHDWVTADSYFFIVSSTAGGTGSGNSRNVARMLLQIAQEGDLPHDAIHIRLVRVGRRTFRKIRPVEIALNTYFTVVQDAGFHNGLPQDTPADLGWYYLEVPPAGVGDDAYPVRERRVSAVVRSMFHNEVQQNVQAWANNDLAMVRVGYWTKEWDADTKYKESLNGLANKLSELLNPPAGTYTPLDDRGEFQTLPHYTAPDLKGILEAASQVSQLEQVIGSVKIDVSPIGTQKDWAIRLRGWAAVVKRLTGFSVPDSGTLTRLDLESGNAIPMTADSLQRAKITDYDEDWFTALQNDQYVREWYSAHYQVLPPNSPAINKMLALWKLASECEETLHTGGLFGNAHQRSVLLAEKLPQFVSDLSEALTWRACVESAKNHEMRATQELLALQGKLDQRVIEVGAALAPRIYCADLHQLIGHRSQTTWLARLVEYMGDEQLLRETIIDAAIGLTRDGLLEVLGLAPGARTEQIHDALSECGSATQGTEGHWFDDQTPLTNVSHMYRVFPAMDPVVRNELGSGANGLTYVYTTLGATELNILALEGTAVLVPNPADPSDPAPVQDLVGSFCWILRGMAKGVQNQFSQWDYRNHGAMFPALQILKSISSWETLSFDVLADENAGLTEEQIICLAQYAQFQSKNLHDPTTWNHTHLNELRKKIEVAAKSWGPHNTPLKF